MLRGYVCVECEGYVFVEGMCVWSMGGVCVWSVRIEGMYMECLHQLCVRVRTHIHKPSTHHTQTIHTLQHSFYVIQCECFMFKQCCC